MATLIVVLTDIEGSTRRWVEETAAMRAALERHDAIVTAAVGAAGGTIFKHTGDGMLASLPSAATATEGSIEELSDRLHPASWAAADPAGRVNQYRLMLDRLAK